MDSKLDLKVRESVLPSSLRKKGGELPGFSKIPLESDLIGIEKNPHNPPRAPGKLHSDLEQTIHWIFAQVWPQTWILAIVLGLQRLQA